MVGTITNTVLVVVGSIIGLILRKGIPDNIKNVILIGLGIFTCVLGIKMGIQMESPIIVIVSLVIGGVIGEILKIEKSVEQIGERFKKISGFSESRTFAQGFVIASILFSIGPMTVLGCVQDGLLHKPELLITKSIMDGISAIILTSTLGIGVIFSAIVVFLFQGSITLLAGQLNFLAEPHFLNDFTGIGGILILAIGIRLLGIKDIKAGNFLPALILVVIFRLIT
ncbi:MAG: DUF554 domain-containing protein [bacterium]